ncbi:polyketide synthase, partial [Saccharothrix sp. MB29]|nr:polyketide synthase [Saccharothrix sp. MB29]
MPWVVSARSEAALRAQAAQLLPLLDANPVDVAHSLVEGRAVLEYRAVVRGGRPALEALADGRTHPDLVVGQATGDAGVAFLFSG